jgi:hypothetical protein
MKRQTNINGEAHTANSTYKKLAIQWLHEVLCFLASSVVADSFVLRKRQLLVAANRCSINSIKKQQKTTCPPISPNLNKNHDINSLENMRN